MLLLSIMVELESGQPTNTYRLDRLGFVTSADEGREKALNHLFGLKYKSAEVSLTGFGTGSGTRYTVTPTHSDV